MKGGKRVKEKSLSLVPISPVDPKAEPSNREKKFQSEPQLGSWTMGSTQSHSSERCSEAPVGGRFFL